MNITRRHAMIAGLSAGFSTIGIPQVNAEWERPLLGAVEGGEEFWLATDAYRAR